MIVLGRGEEVGEPWLPLSQLALYHLVLQYVLDHVCQHVGLLVQGPEVGVQQVGSLMDSEAEERVQFLPEGEVAVVEHLCRHEDRPRVGE